MDENEKKPKGEDDALTQKAKKEALLTAGMGYGNKKRAHLDAFWSMMWPGLEQIGWKRIIGEGTNEGSMIFLPPNVDMKAGKRNVDYYDKVKLVIERVEERRNKDEAKLADLFREETRDDHNIALLADPTELPRRGPGRPPKLANMPSSGIRRGPGRPPKLGDTLPTRNVRIVDISWKDGGSNYPKRCSRVGDEYQVRFLPPSSMYSKGSDNHESECEKIWDPLEAKTAGVIDFINDTVPSNKRENVFSTLYRNGYSSNNLTEIVDNALPSDCSDWTKAEKEKFRLEIFRKRKNFKSLCNIMKKDMGSILCYYLGTYKKSDDYRLLKTVCIEERIDKAESAAHDLDQCAICEDGGSLLICDGCETEWHMTCTRPALKTVPEGYWECDMCVDRKFLAGRQRLIRSTSLMPATNGKRKLEPADSNEGETKRIKSKTLDAVKEFAQKINLILSPPSSQSEHTNSHAGFPSDDG